jgi:hypothetical protein
MKWMTISPYTRTTIFSRFVKRQTNSQKIYKGLSGTKSINTTILMSSVPEHPKNKNTVWEKKLSDSINLFGNGEKCTELHEIAYSDFCFTEFELNNINMYAYELARSKYREYQNYKRELAYNKAFGILWEVSPLTTDDFVHEDKLLEVQVRLHESIERCKYFDEKEQKFKENILDKM